MRIKTERDIVEITLRLWRGGWNIGFEPDCFYDLETEFPMSFLNRVDGDSIIIASELDTKELIAWWTEECRAVNRGEDGVILVALTKDEIERGDEWCLGVEVVKAYD